MTRRGLAVATAAAAFAAAPWAGTAYLDVDLSVLFYPACLLAATLAIACLLVGLCANPAVLRRSLAVEQMTQPSVAVGETTEIACRVTWVGALARVITATTHVRWAQSVGHGLAPLDNRRAGGPIDDGVTTSFTARAMRRGVLRVGPLMIHASDPWGLWRTEVQVAPGVDVLGIPRVHALDSAAAALAGDVDGAAIREYRSGDEMRRVHWKASAHRAKLMVRDDEHAAAPGVTFVVEDRDVDLPALDFACEAVASAAVASHRAGHDVQVMSASGSVDVVALSGRPVGAILSALARVEPATGGGYTTHALGSARWPVRALVPAGREGAAPVQAGLQTWTYAPGDDVGAVARALSASHRESPHA